MSYSLAIDIGASSGRHILGSIIDGKIVYEEVYRFENKIEVGDSLTWDIDNLVNEVINGIKKCKEIGKIPATLAIDTWGVDYVLLDENKKEIMPVVAYRDSRGAFGMSEVDKVMSGEKIYSITGIQRNAINTIYQLYCDKLSGKLDKAAHFLMIPEYLSFKLTGEIKNEYTNASTTSLLNAKTKTWDTEILDTLGIKKDIFKPLSKPSDFIGRFTDEIKSEVGFDCDVVFCPSHDTASAVAAIPLEDGAAYISSGTWSLIGVENLEPVLSELSRECNFANEGGVNYRFRYLKNFMGMWLFQNIRKNLDKKYTYDEMMYMAMESDFTEYIDPNAEDFLAPENMIEAVRGYLGKPDLPLGDVLSSVYHSLAKSYKEAVSEIEKVCSKKITSINIVGGGCQDKYLNKLTAQYTGLPVFAGPIEATATGNLISQFIYLDSKLTLESARDIIKKTFDIQEVSL